MVFNIKLDIAGSGIFGEPTKNDIDKNIAALERAIENKMVAGDFVPLIDTLSIINGIKKQLFKEAPNADSGESLNKE